MTLQEKLNDIERRKSELAEEREAAIRAEPATFAHLDQADRAFGAERYRIVYADGSPTIAAFAQRPAALRNIAARANRYVYDRRERVVLRPDGDIVHHRQEATHA